jgi:hypothetical protein
LNSLSASRDAITVRYFACLLITLSRSSLGALSAMHGRMRTLATIC